MNAYEHMLTLLRRYHALDAGGDRLSNEMLVGGHNVVRDFARLKVGPPWVWSPRMEEFYAATDSFVYELLVWHHTPLRIRWRRSFSRRIGQLFPGGARVLCLGDGIAYDSCAIASHNANTRVTSFEFQGYSSAFGGRMIDDLALSERVEPLHDLGQIPSGAFDVVVCLDVLEHVPNPSQVISNIASYLKPGGYLFLSEAFAWVLPTHPTHLESNLRYVGRTASLCRAAGLQYRGVLVDRVLEFSAGMSAGSLAQGVARLREAIQGTLARRYATKRFRQTSAQGATDLVAGVSSEPSLYGGTVCAP